MLPVLIFFLPYKALHLTALVPTYWVFRATEMAIDRSSLFYLFFSGGLLFHLVIIYWLSRKFEKEGT
jgi:hypothetical protein